MNKTATSVGKIIRIAGPVVRAAGLEHVRLYDVLRVGELGLIGEVIRLSEEATTIQVYEDTSGIRVGEPVHDTGLPLVVQQVTATCCACPPAAAGACSRSRRSGRISAWSIPPRMP